MNEWVDARWLNVVCGICLLLGNLFAICSGVKLWICSMVLCIVITCEDPEELGKLCCGAGGSGLCKSGSCDEEQGLLALCTAAKPFILNIYSHTRY